MRLEDFLAAAKAELVAGLCSTADVKGRECWLWLPKKPMGTHPGPCLVAHVDTVWDRRHGCMRRKRLFHDRAAGVFWSPDGLGADDRAGVYAVTELHALTGCMALLTDGEERGATGAAEAVGIMEQYLRDAAFFVEIDRRGYGEMVFYNNEPPEFRDKIRRFGFHEKHGSFSDVSILGPALEIPAVNVSAGYHREHSPGEYLREKQLRETIRKVLNIVQTTSAQVRHRTPAEARNHGTSAKPAGRVP